MKTSVLKTLSIINKFLRASSKVVTLEIKFVENLVYLKRSNLGLNDMVFFI